MTKEIKNRCEVLKTMLDMCDIPELRKDTSDISNCKWIQRNILIRNNNKEIAHRILSLLPEHINFLLKERLI